MIRSLQRVRRLHAARRARLAAAGRDWFDANRRTPDEVLAAVAAADPSCEPYREAAARSLTTEQIEILLAPGATYADLPELSDAQLAGLTMHPDEMDAETRAAVLALRPAWDDAE